MYIYNVMKRLRVQVIEQAFTDFHVHELGFFTGIADFHDPVHNAGPHPASSETIHTGTRCGRRHVDVQIDDDEDSTFCIIVILRTNACRNIQNIWNRRRIQCGDSPVGL